MNVRWDSSGAAIKPLDVAIDYLRTRMTVVLPLYIIAMLPFTIVIYILLEAITEGRRSAIPFGCLLLTAATFWRWIWITVIQTRIQSELRGNPTMPIRKRIAAIIVTRTAMAFLITWGGFLIIPTLYGLFLSVICAPVLLEDDGKASVNIGKAFNWINKSLGKLIKLSSALTFLIFILLLSAFILQFFMTQTALPSFLGLDAEEVSLTISSWPWVLSMGYIIFLIFDILWTVTGVMLFYNLQSRRLGTDLRFHLQRRPNATLIFQPRQSTTNKRFNIKSGSLKGAAFSL